MKFFVCLQDYLCPCVATVLLVLPPCVRLFRFPPTHTVTVTNNHRREFFLSRETHRKTRSTTPPSGPKLPSRVPPNPGEHTQRKNGSFWKDFVPRELP